MYLRKKFLIPLYSPFISLADFLKYRIRKTNMSGIAVSDNKIPAVPTVV